MLRDVFSGITFAAVTGALYGIGMYSGALTWKPGDDAFHLLLLLVGVLLSATRLFVEFVGSRLDRRLRQDMARIDERNRLFDEAGSARALRLNAFLLGQPGCIATNGPVCWPEPHERQAATPFSGGLRHTARAARLAAPDTGSLAFDFGFRGPVVAGVLAHSPRGKWQSTSEACA